MLRPAAATGIYLYGMMWNVEEIDTEDVPGLQRSLVRIYMKDGYASCAKTWWLDREESCRKKEILYRFVKCVEVSGECAWTSDLGKILREGSEEEEELMTLFTDKVLYPFQHLVFGEGGLKHFAGFLIRGCRDRLIPLVNHNSNSKLYSISLSLCVDLSVTLGVKAWTWFQEYNFGVKGLEQPPPGMLDYDHTSPMPLPRIVGDGYDFFQLGGGGANEDEEKTCAICFRKYEPQCLVIRLQCVDELLPEHSHKVDTAAAMLLPCKHIFHANCLARWFQVSDDQEPNKPLSLRIITCPLCRFEIPSHYFFFSLARCFPLKSVRFKKKFEGTWE